MYVNNNPSSNCKMLSPRGILKPFGEIGHNSLCDPSPETEKKISKKSQVIFRAPSEPKKLFFKIVVVILLFIPLVNIIIGLIFKNLFSNAKESWDTKTIQAGSQGRKSQPKTEITSSELEIEEVLSNTQTCAIEGVNVSTKLIDGNIKSLIQQSKSGDNSAIVGMLYVDAKLLKYSPSISKSPLVIAATALKKAQTDEELRHAKNSWIKLRHLKKPKKDAALIREAKGVLNKADGEFQATALQDIFKEVHEAEALFSLVRKETISDTQAIYNSLMKLGMTPLLDQLSEEKNCYELTRKLTTEGPVVAQICEEGNLRSVIIDSYSEDKFTLRDPELGSAIKVTWTQLSKVLQNQILQVKELRNNAQQA